MKNLGFILTALLLGSNYVSGLAQEVKINSNFAVEADGTFRLDGNATVYDDFVVMPNATGTGSSNAPKWGGNIDTGAPTYFINDGAGSQGPWLLGFSPTTEQEVYFTVQLPHTYKQGTSMYPHVHWTTRQAGTGPNGSNVVWGLEYGIADVGATFPATTTTTTTNSIIGAITLTNAPRQHLISSFGAIALPSGKISSIMVCRLYRKAGDAADTFPWDTYLLSFDFHVEQDTQGSRQEFIK